VASLAHHPAAARPTERTLAMFDLISGDHRRVPHRDTVPLFLSIATHVLAIGAVAAVPLLYVTSELPEVPDILAFVAAAPAPPPPPPPPPAAARSKPVPKPVPVRTRAAPVEPAQEIVAEASEVDFTGEEGIPGGVEGGVPGGIVGGIVGGLVPIEVLPPPPPPPASPVDPGPVRVGGAVTAPALVSRVEPEYPPLAVRAQVQGVVILEAVVDRQGRVEQVEILRSIPLLDKAAVAAVRQWRYSPLLLNGKPERFVLTVTVSFSLNT
jgi:periplasmic protein TonB